MLFLKLFYMTAKCKLHESKQLIRSAWRSHAFARGVRGYAPPRKFCKNLVIWRVLNYISIRFCLKYFN